MEDQKAERVEAHRQLLARLGLSLELEAEMLGLSYYSEILEYAVRHGLTWWAAEPLYLSERGNEAGKANEWEQAAVTGQVYTENPQNSFAGERGLYRKIWKQA